MKQLECIKDRSFNIPKCKFSKLGFIFSHWIIENMPNKKFVADQQFTFGLLGIEECEIISFVAQWKPKYDDSFFGLAKYVTRREKLDILSSFYREYSSRIILDDEKIKTEAKEVLACLAYLRQKIQDNN